MLDEAVGVRALDGTGAAENIQLDKLHSTETGHVD